MPPSRAFLGVFLLGETFHVSRVLQQMFSVSRATQLSEQGEPECSSGGEGEADSLGNSAPGSSAKATSTGAVGASVQTPLFWIQGDPLDLLQSKQFCDSVITDLR